MAIQTLLHMLFMLLTVAMVITAAVTANRKSTGKWLKKHRFFAILGVVSACTGGLVMFYYKNFLNYPHFTAPHSIAGLVTLCLAFIMIILGFILLNGKEGIRSVHRILGRITAVIAPVTAIFGLLTFLKLMNII